MRAAARFAARLERRGLLDRVATVRVDLYGSLGATGRGHGTGMAVVLGLEGARPDTVDPATIPGRVAAIEASRRLRLAGRNDVAVEVVYSDRVSHDGADPFHVNNVCFTALDADGVTLEARTYYSVGGGFVVDDDLLASADPHAAVPTTTQLPLPFGSAAELLGLTAGGERTIADVVRFNERTWRTDEEIDRGLLRTWNVMQACVERGIATDGVLPGGLGVRRRAKALHAELLARGDAPGAADPLDVMDWVNLFALAVNEENAAGGRVVTAPTNGAAGIIPAVLHYYTGFGKGASDAGVVEFLLTATAIGILFKENASISGAEVGCQGEVGVACSMAAAGLCAVMGGTPAQVENAAEIGIEHNLGLTCDPVGGLVQVPCIERNAMGAVQAINAARMALAGDGSHRVSLDAAIATMRETGADMHHKYKETSRGGLALNVVEC
jgi:L-serine dehydratase